MFLKFKSRKDKMLEGTRKLEGYTWTREQCENKRKELLKNKEIFCCLCSASFNKSYEDQEKWGCRKGKRIKKPIYLEYERCVDRNKNNDCGDFEIYGSFKNYEFVDANLNK